MVCMLILKMMCRSGSLTSILYMNTNNGYTKFETGETVQSVENRLVTFSNHVQHTGSTNNCDTVQ